MKLFCKCYKKIPAIIITSVSLLALTSSVYAFRCGSHLISEGDLAIKVKKYCGKPDWIDRWYEKVVYAEDTNSEHILRHVNQRWVYNFGPRKFMRFLVIRNNRVVHIDTGGYGFYIPKTSRCDTSSFSLGMSSLEVKSKCGAPDSVSRRYETLTRPMIHDTKVQMTVPIDEWVYNLGPRYFIRILTFRQDRLIDIKTDSRGF